MARPPFDGRQTNSAAPRPRTRIGRGRWLPLLLFAALAVLPLYRGLTGGVFLPLDIMPHMHPWRYSYERVPVNNPTNTDVVQQVYPRRVLTDAIMRQGALPLWNPTILTGTPLLADGQMTFFYPPSFLFLLLPLARAFGWYALLQLVLAAAGTYLLLRQLGLDRWPATLAGVAFMFNGYMLTWLHYPHHTGAVAMLPWCFWAVARACRQDRVGPWLVAGVALSLPVLIHLQIAFYTFLGAGWFVAAALIERQPPRARWRRLLGFGLALAIGVALGAAQLLPQAALAAEGQRTAQAFEPLSDEGRFFYLLRLVLPATAGVPLADPGPWGPPLLQLPQPYTGLAPLALAVVAMLLSRRRATSIFATLAVISLALALRTPLVQLAIALVPPYGQFRDQARWFVLWGFAIAVLAGLGSEALLQRRGPPVAAERRTLVFNQLLLALSVLFVAAWSWRHLALWTPSSRYGTYITALRQQPLGIPLLIVAASALALLLFPLRRAPASARWSLLLAVVVGDILWYGGSYNTNVDPRLYRPTADLVAALPDQAAQPTADALYPPTRQIAFLQRQPGPFRIHAADYPALLPNFASTFGLEDIRGYQSLYLARYNRLVRLIDGKDYTELAREGASSFQPYLTTAYRHRRLLDMLNVAFFVFPPGSELAPRYAPLELVQEDDEGTIYRNPAVLPRAWLVHNVEVIGDDIAQLDRMARADFDPAAVVVLPAAAPPVLPPPAPEAAPLVEYAPNRLRVQATAAAPAILVVSDAYTSDWAVEVDGEPAELLRANYAFRGVWLPAGSHEITFTYRPRSFILGCAISLLTLLGLVAYAAVAYRRGRTPLRP